MPDQAPTGQFHWYELQTTDAAAAEAFYCAVVGWRAEHMGPQPGGYTTFNTAKGGVAGMRTLEAGEGGPAWVGYVATPDVDAAAERLQAAGGVVRQPPTDIPGILRFAAVSDPQGAPFVIYTGFAAEGPPAGGPDEPGYAGWRELMAADGAKALAFYAGQFGWSQTGEFDMGPMGVYRLWTDGRGADAGGMMTRPPGFEGVPWRYYFQVDAIDAAAARVAAAGGRVENGPMQVPTGIWVLQASDPQGAAFALMSPNK